MPRGPHIATTYTVNQTNQTLNYYSDLQNWLSFLLNKAGLPRLRKLNGKIRPKAVKKMLSPRKTKKATSFPF